MATRSPQPLLAVWEPANGSPACWQPLRQSRAPEEFPSPRALAAPVRWPARRDCPTLTRPAALHVQQEPAGRLPLRLGRWEHVGVAPRRTHHRFPYVGSAWNLHGGSPCRRCGGPVDPVHPLDGAPGWNTGAL